MYIDGNLKELPLHPAAVTQIERFHSGRAYIERQEMTLNEVYRNWQVGVLYTFCRFFRLWIWDSNAYPEYSGIVEDIQHDRIGM